jgi:hypothetical protein
MNEKPEHSPTPWKVKVYPSLVEIVSESRALPVVHWLGFDESSIPRHEHVANATLIVEAVNAYASLVQQIEELKKELEKVTRVDGIPDTPALGSTAATNEEMGRHHKNCPHSAIKARPCTCAYEIAADEVEARSW